MSEEHFPKEDKTESSDGVKERNVKKLVEAVNAAYSAYAWIPEKDFISLFEEVARLAGIVEEGWDASVKPNNIEAAASAVLARYGNPPKMPIVEHDTPSKK